MTVTSDTVTMREAAQMLDVSNAKIWRLVKQGVLSAQQNPLDRREKLIRREDVERLRRGVPGPGRFVSDGIDVDAVDIPSSSIKDWIRETWRPHDQS